VDLLEKVKETIQRYRLFTPGDRVLVALSGGPDSVCLLHLLVRLQATWQLDLHAVHVHHGLRASADEDAAFCQRLAQQLAIPFTLCRVDVPAAVAATGESVQEAARRLRYQELEAAAAQLGAGCVAVGHHRNDQAETVLMNLLRGAGLRGLRGMLPRQGLVVRPLLDIARADIEAYCREQGLEPLRDPSNEQLTYLRNRIRHELLPLLAREYNPQIVDHLVHLADIVREEYALLATRTAELLNQHAQPADNGWELALPGLLGLTKADQRRLVRGLYRRLLEPEGELGYGHVQAVLDLASEGKVHSRLELPGEVVVSKTYHALTFQRRGRPRDAEAGAVRYEYQLPVPGAVYIKEMDVTLSTSVYERAPASTTVETSCLVQRAYFDYNKLELPLTVRNRRPGDRFQPMGMQGTKKIKDFFIDEKVPQHLRERIPIVLTGETILWVAGYRVSEAARITPETRQVLEITMVKGKHRVPKSQRQALGEGGFK